MAFKCEMCGKEVKRGKRHELSICEMDSHEKITNGQSVEYEDMVCSKCVKLISNAIERTRRNARERGRL